MKKLSIVLAVLFLFNLVFSEELSPKAKKAKEMVDTAVLLIKKEGTTKAYPQIADKTNKKFNDGEFYVWVNDITGPFYVHPSLMGKSLLDVKSPEGYELGKEITKVAIAGTLWLNYKWPNIVTKKVADKTSYIVRLKGKDVVSKKDYDLIIGCGYNKE